MAAEVYGKLPVEEVSDIDAKDVGCAASRSAFALVSADVPRVVCSTPDEWVPRHPRMVRLTGRHPFNVAMRVQSGTRPSGRPVGRRGKQQPHHS